ncbi:MAG: bifunctional oligoribonuclease/PAP phosphatase NrnA [Nautilia sp.]|nr:MAG: bifunctional oligoribonuclease/PAP phosphatase NrnA [Nautilia sp.]
MYKKIWNKIKESDNIVLISHINPDGDALGSSLSMYNILKNMNKKVIIVNMTEPAKYLDFLPNFDKVKKELPKKIDLMISFDCGSFDRLGIERRDYFLINLDHHISNTNYGDMNLIEPNAASTSQVVFNILEANSIKIDKDSATCIYTALVTDTGNFQYESVTAEVFRVASELVKAGANPDFISKMLYQRDRLSRLRFLAKALDTLELYLEGQVSVVEITKELMDMTGAVKDDTEGLVNMIRAIESVEVALLLREEDEGIKISLRSKNYVDVSKIATKYGGGGHIRASGATIKDKTFTEIKEMILADIKEQLK